MNLSLISGKYLSFNTNMFTVLSIISIVKNYTTNNGKFVPHLDSYLHYRLN